MSSAMSSMVSSLMDCASVSTWPSMNRRLMTSLGCTPSSSANLATVAPWGISTTESSNTSDGSRPRSMASSSMRSRFRLRAAPCASCGGPLLHAWTRRPRRREPRQAPCRAGASLPARPSGRNGPRAGLLLLELGHHLNRRARFPALLWRARAWGRGGNLRSACDVLAASAPPCAASRPRSAKSSESSTQASCGRDGTGAASARRRRQAASSCCGAAAPLRPPASSPPRPLPSARAQARASWLLALHALLSEAIWLARLSNAEGRHLLGLLRKASTTGARRRRRAFAAGALGLALGAPFHRLAPGALLLGALCARASRCSASAAASSSNCRGRGSRAPGSCGSCQRRRPRACSHGSSPGSSSLCNLSSRSPLVMSNSFCQLIILACWPYTTPQSFFLARSGAFISRRIRS